MLPKAESGIRSNKLTATATATEPQPQPQVQTATMKNITFLFDRNDDRNANRNSNRNYKLTHWTLQFTNNNKPIETSDGNQIYKQ